MARLRIDPDYPRQAAQSVWQERDERAAIARYLHGLPRRPINWSQDYHEYDNMTEPLQCDDCQARWSDGEVCAELCPMREPWGEE